MDPIVVKFTEPEKKRRPDAGSSLDTLSFFHDGKFQNFPGPSLLDENTRWSVSDFSGLFWSSSPLSG